MEDIVVLRWSINACLVVAAVGCSETDPENRPPTAGDSQVTLDEDATARGAFAAGDPDGDDLEIAIVTAPRSGTVTTLGGDFIYTPGPNFHGEDELVYVAGDGELTSAEARVTFRIAPVDDPPQLAANTFSGPAGLRLAGQLAVTDPDGDPVTVSVADSTVGHFLELDPATGRFVFEPIPSFAGAEELALTATAGGATTTGAMKLTIVPVSFGGDWTATDVRVDNRTNGYRYFLVYSGAFHLVVSATLRRP
jgi:hypothetical protein